MRRFFIYYYYFFPHRTHFRQKAAVAQSAWEVRLWLGRHLMLIFISLFMYMTCSFIFTSHFFTLHCSSRTRQNLVQSKTFWSTCLQIWRLMWESKSSINKRYFRIAFVSWIEVLLKPKTVKECIADWAKFCFTTVDWVVNMDISHNHFENIPVSRHTNGDEWFGS